MDDEIFIAQLFELLVYEYCESKSPLKIDPVLESGKTPEMIWDINGEQVLLDVVTLFESKEDAIKEKN